MAGRIGFGEAFYCVERNRLYNDRLLNRVYEIHITYEH